MMRKQALQGQRKQKDGEKPTRRKPLAAVPVPEEQHAAWYQLLRAHGRLLHGIESRLLGEGQIPHHWYDVLVALEKAPQQRLRLSELADHIVTSRSNLTRLVDRLEAEGLLNREPCPDDRRGSYAVLTAAGARARLAAWPTVSRAIVELFALHTSDEEAKVLTEVLQRIADAPNSSSRK